MGKYRKWLVFLCAGLVFPGLASAVEIPTILDTANAAEITEEQALYDEGKTQSTVDTPAGEAVEPVQSVPAFSPASEAVPETPDAADPATSITVSFHDGDVVLGRVVIPQGSAPSEVPQVDYANRPILAWIAGGQKVSDPTSVSLQEDTTYTVWRAPALNTKTHDSYISGKGRATFAPMDILTRAEATALIYGVLQDQSLGPITTTFSDVEEGQWYYEAVSVLTSLGLIGGYQDGSFLPNKTITKSEFIAVLAPFAAPSESSLEFTDVPQDFWARDAIKAAVANGWITGSADGTFSPDAPITRAGAVSILNAVLGRNTGLEHKRTLLQEKNVSPFLDVRPSDWFYPAVMEAAVTHSYALQEGQEIWGEFTYPDSGYAPGLQQIGADYYWIDENRQIVLLPAGFQTVGQNTYYVTDNGSISTASGFTEVEGELYYFQENFSIAKNQTIGALSLDENGRYTTGNAELDTLVKQTMLKCTTPSMSRYDKLYACYVYLRDHYTYLNRAHYARGSTDWMEESATWILQKGKGNCYCYAAAFCYMARQLGYQAQAISGGIGTDNKDHAWVMIDGKLYDPEIDYAYRHRYSTRRYYNLFNIEVSDAPFAYFFPNK